MMMKRISALATLLVLGSAGGALAATTPTLQNLDATQVGGVLDTMGAAMAFRPVEPASSYAKTFGFSFGVIGTATSASKINSVIPNLNLSALPAADIFVGIQLPAGLAVEAGALPGLSVSGAKLNTLGGDLKWTLTDTLLPGLPFDLAARFMGTTSKVSFSQTISGVADTVDYKSTELGANLALSVKLAILQPYAGVGVIRQSSTLSNTGSIKLFDNTVSQTDSFASTGNSLWLYGGLQLKLLALTISAEYDSLFGVGSAAAKVGFQF